MSNQSEIDKAIGILEAARKDNALSEEQRSRVAPLASMAEKTRPALERALSAADENAILQTYSQQYDRLPDDLKKRCDWKTVSERLLANGSEKLKLAQDMQGGGELFGIDSEGKVMFKDKGVEPVLYGRDEKGKLVRIYDRDLDQINALKAKWAKNEIGPNRIWANYNEIRSQVRAEGYELFSDLRMKVEGDGTFIVYADNGGHDKDHKSESAAWSTRHPETLYGILDSLAKSEANREEPFVASENRNELRRSWLESGFEPEDAFYVVYRKDGKMHVVSTGASMGDEIDWGVVRLLKV